MAGITTTVTRRRCGTGVIGSPRGRRRRRSIQSDGRQSGRISSFGGFRRRRLQTPRDTTGTCCCFLFLLFQLLLQFLNGLLMLLDFLGHAQS